MLCAKCGTENPRGKKFCGDCGTPLANLCPSCGSASPGGKRFCGDCGAALSISSVRSQPARSGGDARGNDPSSKAEGERRHLTVLFSDLVGSTRIAAQLDPEEWRELLAEYHRVATDAIARFGGFVAQYLGDGVMAYFGWPEAHDNDAERAARAGLALIDEIASLNQRSAAGIPRLAVRVGLDSGTVVIGQRANGESGVFGDAPNVAARVQAAADPDTVIASAATNRLVSGLFVVEDRGAHELKGIPGPLVLYRIVRASGARNRMAASSVRGLTRFVGREDELGLLWSRWERAHNGEGHVVLISGEAGIGKSRLVRQFRELMAGTPHTWLECGGAPYFQNTPFYPIIDMLQNRFAERRSETDEQKLQDLEQGFEIAGLKPAEAVPLVAPMLNVATNGSYSAPMLSPEQQRRRLLATLCQWVCGSARTQPAVMALEDLHWFDASTLELVNLLLEQGATSPVLLLLTSRLEFRMPWRTRAHHTHLTLNRLSAPDVRSIVAGVVAEFGLSGETIEGLVERAGGVPLFVEELTRAVLEAGDAKPAAREIPATLHDSLMARLDRLGSAKEVAQIASIIGREFSYELLLAVSAFDEDELQSALTRLSDADLVYAEGVPPDALYRFKHALIQDAAYEALLKSRRRDLHRRVARVLTEQFPAKAEEHPEMLASHWTAAAEAEPALAAWKKAADGAYKRRGFREAEQGYRQALALLDELPRSTEHDTRETELTSALGHVLKLTRGPTAREYIEVAERASMLAEREGNLSQLIRQKYATWASAFVSGDHRSVGAAADEMLELASRERSDTAFAFAHYAQIGARFYRGDLAGVEQHFELSCRVCDDPVFRRSPGPGIVGFGFGTICAWILGHSDRARERISQGLARAVENPYELAFIKYFESWLYAWMGDIPRSEAAAQLAVKLSDENGFPYVRNISSRFVELAQVQRGCLSEIVARMQQSLTSLVEGGARLGIPETLARIAEIQAMDGRIDDAFNSIENALQANPEEQIWMPFIITCRGDLYHRVGNRELAERDYREALLLAQKMDARAFQLRATTRLARALQERNECRAAREILAPIYDGFSEGLNTADLKSAKALLDELNG